MAPHLTAASIPQDARAVFRASRGASSGCISQILEAETARLLPKLRGFLRPEM
jgi:hypothetical protein